MSTILDALRKVEQDNRERNADARARLLSSPLHAYDSPARQKHTALLFGFSLALVGFLVGGGLVYTRLQPPQIHRISLSPFAPAAPHPPTQVAQLPQSGGLPPSPDQAAAPFVPLPKPDAQPQRGARLLQRSPFVSVAPPLHRPPAQSEPEYIIEPLEPDFWSDPLPDYEQAEQAYQPDYALQANPAQRDALLIPSPSAPARPSQASLGLLQWSPEADKRLAFIKIGDGPLTMVYEGDRVGGFTVVAIRKDSVDLRSGGAHGDLLTLHSR